MLEQQKIGNFLSAFDKKISLLEQKTEQLEAFKKGTIQQLLTGKKRFQEFVQEEGFKETKLGMIPKDWEVKKLGIVTEIDQENLGTKTSANYTFSYISLSDVKMGFINEELETFSFDKAPSRARRIVQKGSTLIATVRPNLQGFAYVDKTIENTIASTGFAVINGTGQATSNFVYYHFYANYITYQLYKLTVGSNYPAVNSSDIKNLQIPLPSLPEQKKIANCLSSIDQQIQGSRTQLEATKAYKKGLLQQLLV